MNPNAKEFVFNPSARVWSPNFGVSAPPDVPPSSKVQTPLPIVPPPAPQATVQVVSTPHMGLEVTKEASYAKELDIEVPPSSKAQQGDRHMKQVEEDDDDEIDEDDPLWKATLQLTLGDRERAIKLLEDPDALLQYPEIKRVMEEQAQSAEAGDDWETTAEKNETSSSVESSAGGNPTIISEVEPKGDSSVRAAISPSKKMTGEEEEEAGEASSAADVVLQDGDPREHLNIVFIGHVDAGKSTLSGSILYLMGKVDARTIERFEREAKQRNRESWFLAFIMDTSEEERAKGKTVEVGRAHFETDSSRYTILDAPGHKNYVPNMISGAAQADVGVLVISARKGEFETGFEKGGQTREHALLARTLGVAHLVVVINKMDDPTVEWDVGRYEECVSKLKPYLKQVGYVIKTDVKFIPISGLSGDNVLNEVSSAKCPWWKEMYSGGVHNTTQPTLLSILDSLTIPNRNPDGPLRVPCLDRYFERGCVVLGKVESGTLRVGDEIVIMPTRKKARVEEVVIGDVKVRAAKPGENVLIKLAVNVEDIQKGYVISSASGLCPAVREIKVQLALVEMLDHRPIFTSGYDAVMHVHTVEIEVTCVKLLSVLEKGKALPRPYARQGQVCVAKLAMPLNTCMETFERMAALGRLTLRDEGRTIAIGKILELYKDKAAVTASAAK